MPDQQIPYAWVLNFIYGENGKGILLAGVFVSADSAEQYAQSITRTTIYWKHEYPTLYTGYIHPPQMIGDYHLAWWSVERVTIDAPLQWLAIEAMKQKNR